MNKCKWCGGTIDRTALEAVIAKDEVPEVARRAAAASVFCSVRCGCESFASTVELPTLLAPGAGS